MANKGELEEKSNLSKIKLGYSVEYLERLTNPKGKTLNIWKESKRVKECHTLLCEGTNSTLRHLNEINSERTNLESIKEFVKMEGITDSNLEDEIKGIHIWKTREFRGRRSQLLGGKLENILREGKTLLDKVLNLKASFEQYEIIIRGHLIQLISLLMHIRVLQSNLKRLTQVKDEDFEIEERYAIILNWDRQYGESMLEAFERLINIYKKRNIIETEKLDTRETDLIMNRFVKTCKRKRRRYYKSKRIAISKREKLLSLEDIKHIVMEEEDNNA